MRQLGLVFVLAFSAAIAALAVGCGDDGGGACTPGETEDCTCPGGGDGMRICSADGRFGACVCGDLDAGPTDGGRDGGMDSGTDAAGDDGGTDAGTDSGTDSGSDAAMDADPDASTDGDVDGDVDADLDAAGDAGDAGFDARTADMCLDLGRPCLECAFDCTFDSETTVVGMAPDEIIGHPMGRTSYTTVTWTDGYCTPGSPTAETPAPCVLGDVGIGFCGPCGTCVGAGTTAAGEQVTVCLRSCMANVTDNDVCRDTYECSLTLDACVPGCTVDDECRVFREDTDRNGIIDDGPGAGGVDRLRYDTMSDGVCDSATYRCSHTGPMGADAGDPCTRDSQCEADGVCLPESDGDWIGGYCTKFGCDVAGNECAGAGVCRDRRIGVSICTASCTVAAGGGTTPMEWIADRGGCRGGYMCAWDGVGTAGMAGNGHCLPGVFNAITTSNVGATCMDSGECYSPFGYGQCTGISEMGYCSVIDCGAPGVPAGVCGPGNTCVMFAGGITACTEGCTTPADCSADVGCLPLGAGGTAPFVCVGCTDDTHCQAGRICDAMPGFIGNCVPGLPP